MGKLKLSDSLCSTVFPYFILPILFCHNSRLDYTMIVNTIHSRAVSYAITFTYVFFFSLELLIV